MSDTEQSAQALGKPCRRWRRLFGAVVAICVLALFVALSIWAARPRWYTYVSKHTTAIDGFMYYPRGVFPLVSYLVMPKPEVRTFALSFRLPIGWECKPKDVDPHGGYIHVEIRRKPMAGFVLWWNQHVLGLNTNPLHSETFDIGLVVATGGDDPNQSIQEWKDGPFGRDPHLQTFEHPLGPAIQAIGPYPQNRQSGQFMVTHIAARLIPIRQRVWIDAEHFGSFLDFSRTQSTWNEIVHSIRVVQK